MQLPRARANIFCFCFCFLVEWDSVFFCTSTFYTFTSDKEMCYESSKARLDLVRKLLQNAVGDSIRIHQCYSCNNPSNERSVCFLCNTVPYITHSESKMFISPFPIIFHQIKVSQWHLFPWQRRRYFPLLASTLNLSGYESSSCAFSFQLATLLLVCATS